MKAINIKFVSLFVSVLLLLSVFAACDTAGKQNETIVTDAPNAEQPTDTDEAEDGTESAESTTLPQDESTSESASESQGENTSENPTESEDESSSDKPTETESENTSESPTESESEEITECSHLDIDNNGLCDGCDIDVIIEIDLYAINDLHGKFLDSNRQPGVDELTTYFKNAYKANPNTFVFSSGDMWQGSAESGLTKGGIMTDWMNEIDLTFMTLGNHEFDWGASYIDAQSKVAEFPFLAINIYEDDSNTRADFCESSVVVDLGEVQIGFIGAIGDCYSSISGDMSEGYCFLVEDDLTALVKAEAKKLRAEGVDFIVYSLHDGTYGCDISLTADGYVDLVFEGHSHAAYCEMDANGVYHVQGGGENSGMSYAEVSINFANFNNSVEAKLVSNTEYSSCEPDSIVDELSEKYSDVITLVEKVVGTNDKYRNATFLRNMVAAQYAALSSEWSSYNVVLGGGFLSCRSPSELPSGEVKYGELYMLFPFDNQIALCSCSGEALLKNFINSTNSNYFISYTEYGETVKDSIDPNATYYLITDSYNYTYAPNGLTVVEVYNASTYARDLAAKFIEAGGLNDTDTPEFVLTPIVELNAIAEALSGGDQTDQEYYVEGKIVEILNVQYGNMYLEDSAGNKLYVYGINGFREMADQPKVGDTIILCGPMKKYVASNDGSIILEMIKATYITSVTPIPKVIEMAKSLADGDTSTEAYTVVGKIVEIAQNYYGNIYIEDQVGNRLYVYGTWQNGKRYGELDSPPQVGDTVILYGVMKNYVKTGQDPIYEMVDAEILIIE